MVATQLPAMPARPEALKTRPAAKRAEGLASEPTARSFDKELDRAQGREPSPESAKAGAKDIKEPIDTAPSNGDERLQDDDPNAVDDEASRSEGADEPTTDAASGNAREQAVASGQAPEAAILAADTITLGPAPETRTAGLAAVSLPGAELPTELSQPAGGQLPIDLSQPAGGQLPMDLTQPTGGEEPAPDAASKPMQSHGLDLRIFQVGAGTAAKQPLAGAQQAPQEADVASAGTRANLPATTQGTSVTPAGSTDALDAMAPTTPVGVAAGAEPDLSEATASLANALTEESPNAPRQVTEPDQAAADGDSIAVVARSTPEAETNSEDANSSAESVTTNRVLATSIASGASSSSTESGDQGSDAGAPVAAVSPTTATDASAGSDAHAFNAIVSALPGTSVASATASGAATVTQTASPGQLPAVLQTQIDEMAKGGDAQRRLIVRLDPPELGRVTVEVIHRGDEVIVAARTENQEAARALARQREALQTVLETMGMSLSGFDVKEGTSQHTRQDNRGRRDQDGATTTGRFGLFGGSELAVPDTNQGALFL